MAGKNAKRVGKERKRGALARRRRLSRTEARAHEGAAIRARLATGWNGAGAKSPVARSATLGIPRRWSIRCSQRPRIEADLYLVSRNRRDVQRSGASVFDPWNDDPTEFPLSPRREPGSIWIEDGARPLFNDLIDVETHLCH
jgi:hypothetical protein